MAALTFFEIFLTAKTHWDMQLGVRSVPVRAVVIGKRKDAGGGNHDFYHVYELFDFEPYTMPEDFQVIPPSPLFLYLYVCMYSSCFIMYSI